MSPRDLEIRILQHIGRIDSTSQSMIETKFDQAFQSITIVCVSCVPSSWNVPLRVTVPFSLTELCARLRALIRRSAGQAVPVIEIGDIQVDTVGKVVKRRDAIVPLTATEYALVELLAMHRQKLVSRTTIYDHLFDEQDDSLSNLVDVHVSNIRKKLGRDFITTRRGLGYMIEG